MKKGISIGIIALFIITAFSPMVIGLKSDDVKKREEEFLVDYPEHYKNISFGNSNNIESYQAYDTSYIRDFKNTELENKREIWIDEEISDSFENNIDKNYKTYIKDLNRFSLSIIYVPDDYPSIQSAVENATAEDEIIVRNGTYTENIVVDKPLTVRSEKGYTNCTVLQDKSNKHIFTITSDFVTISGFKMKGKESYGKSAVHINNYVNYSTISWNRLIYCFYFIKGKYTNNNIIHDNILGATGSYCENWGIWLEHTSNNHIYNNEIRHLDQYAVSIHCGKGDNNLIENNILRGSYCVGLVSATNNTILDNDMGTGFWAQMYIENSHNNQIINNTFPEANVDGIIVTSSNYNNISNNVFSNSGIFVYESYHNTIEDNTVNNKPLIYLEDQSNRTIEQSAGQIILVNCNYITVKNQDISKTVLGIELFNTCNSVIKDSEFKTFEYEGIYAYMSNKNIIQNCTFSDSCHGFAISNCDDNIIEYNHLHSIDWESAIIFRSNYNTITKNTVTGSFYGIELQNSNYNNISYNEFYSLSQYTYNGVIELFNSDFNNLTYNNIHHNHRGIDLHASDNNLVMKNNFNLRENYVGQNFSLTILKSYDNRIYKNNFINGNVIFNNIHSPIVANWSSNYWYRPRILPKPIFGKIIIGKSLQIPIRWVNFDWRPAQEPYDI